MYKHIIQKIRETLQGVSAIKEVFSFPIPGSPTKSPAVIFFPDGVTNQMESQNRNLTTYRFTLWIVVALNNTTEDEVFSNVLPHAVEEVMNAFGADWDFGTNAGSRVWQTIESGEWGLSTDAKGKVAWAQLTLSIKTQTLA